jgi:hypothetical protein
MFYSLSSFTNKWLQNLNTLCVSMLRLHDSENVALPKWQVRCSEGLRFTAAFVSCQHEECSVLDEIWRAWTAVVAVAVLSPGPSAGYCSGCNSAWVSPLQTVHILSTHTLPPETVLALITVIWIKETEFVNLYMQCFLKTVNSNFILMLRFHKFWWLQ